MNVKWNKDHYEITYKDYEMPITETEVKQMLYSSVASHFGFHPIGPECSVQIAGNTAFVQCGPKL